MGRFLSSSDSKDVCNWVVVVSMVTPASAETWTTVEVVATGRTSLAVDVLLRTTMKFLRVNVAKPDALAVMS